MFENHVAIFNNDMNRKELSNIKSYIINLKNKGLLAQLV